MRQTCCVLMPFANEFDGVAGAIESAAKACKLKYVRLDRNIEPGVVVPQILEAIREACLVVADISGDNPNVYYELGAAHVLKGSNRVVIISQTPERPVYDVQGFQQLRYNPNDLETLCIELKRLLKSSLRGPSDHEALSVIRGRLPRTLVIVRDLQRLLAKSEQEDLNRLTIRVVATMGSLAISDDEPDDPTYEDGYQQALFDERDALRDLLNRGAQMRAIINPPRRFTAKSGRISTRYKRLIGLLEPQGATSVESETTLKDRIAMKHCEIVLSPVSTPNLMIIGNEVAYEGLKRGGKGGFDITHVETNSGEIKDMTKDFETYFTECKSEMRLTYGSDGHLLQQLKSFYAEAQKVAKKKRKRP